MSAAATGPDDDIVLAIDLGTGGPKTAYVALSGDVLDHEHRRVDLQVLPGGGAVEDPDEWWAAVVASAAALAERAVVSPERIIAVACTGQWGSTIPVDQAGRAVGPIMLWLDQRGRELAGRQLGGRLAVEGYRPRAALEWIRRAGGAPNPEGNDPLGHRLWIRHNEPDVYARTAVFLEPIDYLNLRLCGRVAATQATMTLSWLTDNRHLDVTHYDRTLLSLADTDATRLPPLAPIRSVVGEIGAEVAGLLGIRAGTPVVSGLPDLHSATLGSGAVGDFHGHLSISTSAWVGCHTPDKRTSLANQMATVPAALSGRYVLANNHDCGGVSLEWLRDQVVAPDDGLGRGEPTLADLDRVAEGVPAGAGGVLFAPWLKGERSPVSDTSMRASFLNVGIDTGRPELVRAVLEGVAHQLRWIMDASKKVVRHPLRDLHVVGGGAQSDVWCQIHADVLNRPLHRVDQPLLANVRGAALFAGLVTGRLAPDELGGRARIDRVFTPDPGALAVHEELHREFLGLTKSQRGMYHRLNLGR
jgi:xylulokinase